MTPPVPSTRRRVAVALAIGLIYGIATTLQTTWRAGGAESSEPVVDFQYWWTAARALRAGADPYAAIGPFAAYPMPYGFFDPLPAALVTTPLSGLPPFTAVGVFTALGIGLAAFAITARGFWPLWLLASAPATVLLDNGQWAPLMLAAALLPGLGGLLVVKPTIGLALAIYRPRWGTAVGALLLVAASLALQPSWPADWLASVARERQGAQYRPPLTIGPGILCLLAVLRWRRPEARLLLALACVPQNYFFYDQLYLGLVLRSRWQFMVAAIWTQALYAVAINVVARSGTQSVVSDSLAPLVVAGLYVPALLIVLSRANEGGTWSWLERRAASLPSWLRGTPAPGGVTMDVGSTAAAS